MNLPKKVKHRAASQHDEGLHIYERRFREHLHFAGWDIRTDFGEAEYMSLVESTLAIVGDAFGVLEIPNA